MPTSIPAVQSFDRLTAAFPQEYSPHKIVVKATAEQSATVTAALKDLAGRTAGNPLLGGGLGPADQGRRR